MVRCQLCNNPDQSQLRQVCCPCDLIACLQCITNGMVDQGQKCSRCNVRYKNKIFAIINQSMSIKKNRKNQQNIGFMQAQKTQMFQNSMSQTKRKARNNQDQQAYENQNSQQNFQNNYMGNAMNPNFQGQPYPYPNMNAYYPMYPPQMPMGGMHMPMQGMNFIPNPHMVPSYQNWHNTNYCWSPQQQMMMQQGLNQPQNYQHARYDNPHIQNDYQNDSMNRLLKSGRKAINLNKNHDDQDEEDIPNIPYVKKSTIGHYMSSQNKTTDILEQTTKSRSISMNRSLSANSLTIRR